MPSPITALMQERAKLVAKARAIVDRAEGEKRNLNTEETAEYRSIMGWSERGEDGKLIEHRGAQDDVIDRIKRAEELRSIETQLGASAGAPFEPEQPASTISGKPETRSARTRGEGDEYRSAFGKFLADGDRMLGPEEYRALQGDNDSTGGYLIMPQEMAKNLIIFVNNLVFVRQLAGMVYQVKNSESLGIASLDTDTSDPTWTAEIATGAEDTTMAFGKRELRPHPLAKLIKVSRTLLRKATIGPEELIRQRFGYKFGVVEETAFMTGSGQNQPLGLFTASANGVDTSRDVSTGNTTTAIASDNLLEVKYSLKIQHQTDEKTRWVFHRSAVKAIQQLKDGMGRYLWQTSIQEGKPDRLLDIPVVMSEYAPNTFTTGLYVGGLFNFRYYHIADALDMEMQRLDELYANTNQVGFIARKETDGMPVLAEAFARVKLA